MTNDTNKGTAAERLIDEKLTKAGITGERVTSDRIDDVIKEVHYHVFPGTTITVCCLITHTGFSIVGESACADPTNFREATGKEFAYQKARLKLMDFEGYMLKAKLHQMQKQ